MPIGISGTSEKVGNEHYWRQDSGWDCGLYSDRNVDYDAITT